MGIPNIYEMIDLSISDLYEIVELGLMGSLNDVKEKLDGQNFTFTIGHDASVRFLGKGLIKSLVVQGGLNREQLQIRFANRPDSLTESFIDAYDVIQSTCNGLTAELIDELFDGGRIAISAEILNPDHPNIIKYDRKRICFLEPVALNNSDDIDHYAFDDFIRTVDGHMVHGWTINRVPILEPRGPANRSIYEQFKNELTAIAVDHHNVNDVLRSLAYEWLEKKGISYRGVRQRDLACRLAGDKSWLGRKNFDYSSDWISFKELEKMLPLQEIRLPFELWVQRLGIAVMDRYNLSFTPHSITRLIEMYDGIVKYRKAFNEERIIADAKQLRRIELALCRIDESLMKHCAEGIVFRFNNKIMKLVGPFAPVNRLFGYFKYGNNPARIVDVPDYIVL